VVSNADQNKMNVRNVGIVFSPTLNIPAPVFGLFLTEFEAIFGPAPADEAPTRTVEVTVSSHLNPGEIRSPRHQMFTDLPTPGYSQTSFTHAPAANSLAPQTHPASLPSGPHEVSAQEFGFTPMQPAYETRHYLSHPHPAPAQHRFLVPPLAGPPAEYGSLNRLVAPEHDASVRAKHRESSLLLMNSLRRTSPLRAKEEQTLQT